MRAPRPRWRGGRHRPRASRRAALSPELGQARQAADTALEALLAVTRRDAEAPLLVEIDALRAALVAARKEIMEQTDLVDLLHDTADALRSELTRATTPRSPLILSAR